MRKRFVVVAPLFGAAVLVLIMAGSFVMAAGASGDQPKPAAKDPPGSAVFGLTKVHTFHLEISDKDYAAMQPPGGGMGFFGKPPAPGKPPEKPAEKPGEAPRDSDRSAFGVEFPWVHAEFTIDGKTYKNVGIRYKGNSTYMGAARGLKRSLKIELDHYDPKLTFEGLKTLNFHCGIMDPTKGREALAYAVFRAAGVPAPRTSYAEVTLTIPGKYDKEYVGLYILVEQVDRRLLKDRFKNDNGLLMKPERVRGLDYLGENWESYTSRYQPKRDATKAEAQRVIDFVRLINKGSDEEFQREIGSYLDVDAFLKFMAANALLVNMDSFFTLGHNYYLYLHPTTKKFHFIPWDLDLSLGNFAMMGSADQLMDLSISKPFASGNRLTDRLLAMKEVSEKYQKVVEELARTCFTKERLLKDVEAIEKTTKELIAKETKAAAARKEPAGGFGGPGGMMGRPPDLRTFVEKRTASVTAQLEGKSKGYTPAGFGFGPGGGGGRPGGFGMGGFLARPLLEALDTDKDGKMKKEEFMTGATKFFQECDKDKKDKVDEKILADGLNRIFPRPPGFGGAPPAPPPGGRGPGTMFAAPLLKRADADRDGQVTKDELLAAAEALFKECDKDKDGMLDEKEIAAGIELVAPPPAGFGPPPAKPAEPKKEEGKP